MSHKNTFVFYFIITLSLFNSVLATEWTMKQSSLMTEWSKSIDPENVFPEYPRPQKVRDNWLNLNGIWDFSRRNHRNIGVYNSNEVYDQKILVPFPIESAISGIMDTDYANKDKSYVYRRSFSIPEDMTGKNILLNFDAVDWSCVVFINGKKAGEHQGGYDPFSFDITDKLNPSGEQELVVQVYDPTEGDQPRGKQCIAPSTIWYTPSSGIWQTVWLESVEDIYIDDFLITPDIDNQLVKIKINAVSATDNTAIMVRVFDEENQVAAKEVEVGVESFFNLPNAKLWSPESPFLYNLTFELKENDIIKDSIGSYFGMRKISLGQVRDQPYIYLNNQPYFQYGPLDQGFWPDGLYTAPSYDALRYDLEITKELGFNMTRKHLKVEPARWYYYCDSIGLMVWQDLPPGWDDGFHRSQGFDGASWCKSTFIEESKRTIKNLINYPSVAVWVAFNEGGAQFGSTDHTLDVINMIKELDDTRLINPASGWVDFELGDIADVHSYTMPSVPKNVFNLRANVCGETGGYSLETPGHQWGTGQTIYNKVNSAAELTTKLEELNNVGLAMTGVGLCAIIYTQITDLENELNGFYTYDRISKLNDSQKARFKVGIERLKNKATVYVVPTGLTSNSSEWRYLLSDDAPRGWNSEMDFDDSSWLVGAAGFGAGSPPGSKIRTVWDTPDIVMRKKMYIPNLTEDEIDALKLIAHHDDDFQVYINGVLAISEEGYTSSYSSFNLSPRTKAAIKFGEENLIAVKCHQEGGGQYIDVGFLIEIPFDGKYEPEKSAVVDIATPEEFNDIRNNMRGSYRMVADIDLSIYDNFEPIGSLENPFEGSILGNNYVIENLNISGEEDNQGLFGVTRNIFISDLKLLSVNVEGGKNVGALMGQAEGTLIERVAIVDADVKGAENVASFIGESKEGSANIVRDSYVSNGKINATKNNAAGIISVAADALIEKVYFAGNINAPSSGQGINAAGLMALSASDYVKIDQSVSLADSIVGGTAIQFITRTSARKPLVTSSVFANSEMYLSNFAESDRGLGRALRNQSKKMVEFRTQEFYESIGWDFEQVWQMSNDSDYPVLKGMEKHSGLENCRNESFKVKIFIDNDSVTFETDKPTYIWVVDSLGRTISSFSIQNRKTINLSKGIYIIKTDYSGKVQSQKIVVK